MGMRAAILRFYDVARRTITPNLRYSQWHYEDALWECSAGKAAWLDLGCGRCLLPVWRQADEPRLVSQAKRFVGMDYDHESLVDNKTTRNKLRGDASHLPFRDETFDLVSSNMVFEHLQDPASQLKNVCRILRPGGQLVFHTPNSRGYGPVLSNLVPEAIKKRLIWFLQQRKEEDVFPTFYRINTETDIERLARDAGFEIQSLNLVASTPVFVMVPPLLVMELLLIRLLMTPIGRPFRSNIIAVLRKPA